MAEIDGRIVDGLLVAWAHRSRALPERPHLKQWNMFWSRLAEKQRLVPEVEPCKGQGPRCWLPRVLLAWKPSSCRTAAMVDGGADGGEIDGRLRWS